MTVVANVGAGVDSFGVVAAADDVAEFVAVEPVDIEQHFAADVVDTAGTDESAAVKLNGVAVGFADTDYWHYFASAGCIAVAAAVAVAADVLDTAVVVAVVVDDVEWAAERVDVDGDDATVGGGADGMNA